MQTSSRCDLTAVAVLDDDRDSASSITAILNRRGFDATPFTDSASLELAATRMAFGAFVLDWWLQDGTVAPLILRLRSNPIFSAVPIFLLSGNLAVGGAPTDTELADCIAHHRLHYRAKPYSSVKLASDLTHALAQTRI